MNSEDQNIRDLEQVIKIKDVEIKFKTRPGVFSKQGVDAGTRLLLDTLETHDGMLVADLGTGSGILGLYLGKLNYKGHVHLLEDHLRSANLAEENIELNKLRNVEVYMSDLFSAVETRTYHQIFSNPPAQLGNEFLEELITECAKHLKLKGEVWLVVVNHLKPVVSRLLEKALGNYTIEAHGKEHTVLKSVLSSK